MRAWLAAVGCWLAAVGCLPPRCRPAHNSLPAAPRLSTCRSACCSLRLVCRPSPPVGGWVAVACQRCSRRPKTTPFMPTAPFDGKCETVLVSGSPCAKALREPAFSERDAQAATALPHGCWIPCLHRLPLFPASVNASDAWRPNPQFGPSNSPYPLLMLRPYAAGKGLSSCGNRHQEHRRTVD